MYRLIIEYVDTCSRQFSCDIKECRMCHNNNIELPPDEKKHNNINMTTVSRCIHAQYSKNVSVGKLIVCIVNIVRYCEKL